MRKKPATIVFACLFSVMAIVTGNLAMGFWPSAIFTIGYVGGLVIWLLSSAEPSFGQIALPHFFTLALFVVHRMEELKMGFFPALSEITRGPAPDEGSTSAILLYAIAAVWLAIPLLVRKRLAFGYYLAWTFFVSTGVMELAHFVFPIFRDGPYGYFPGMASVMVLVLLAWWGMYRLSYESEDNEETYHG